MEVPPPGLLHFQNLKMGEVKPISNQKFTEMGLGLWKQTLLIQALTQTLAF